MNKKQPLLQVARRPYMAAKYKLLIYLGAFVISFGFTALLLTLIGVDAGKYFENMLTIGLIGSRMPSSNIEGYIELLIPMLIVSLGLALAFRIKFWNIGGEGQFIFGAIAGYLVAYLLTQNEIKDSWVIMIAAGIAGGVAGAIYGLIPALLKIKFRTNETLLTLMLNYIALYILAFFGNTGTAAGGDGVMKNIFLDPKSPRAKFASIAVKSRIPKISIGDFDINVSLIIAILIFVFFIIYLKKSKQGYEMSVVGDSRNTAKYAGMNVNLITIRTVAISAFLVGLAGALYFCSCGQLSESITGNVGFTGIVVAWLAKLNPLMIIVVSILLTILRYGSVQAGTYFSNIDTNFADVFQAIILFTVLACEFFINFKVSFHFNKKNKEVNAQ